MISANNRKRIKSVLDRFLESISRVETSASDPKDEEVRARLLSKRLRQCEKEIKMLRIEVGKKTIERNEICGKLERIGKERSYYILSGHKSGMKNSPAMEGRRNKWKMICQI
ncbi:MAG: hypothetical protein QXU18_09165 [Thermoplasmatales archaeon]